MKKCPNCGELLGDSVTKCFNCFFDMTNPEANNLAEKNRIQRERNEFERKQREIETQRRIAEAQKANVIKAQNERISSLNDYYEYNIVSLKDEKNGAANIQKMSEIINEHAQNGWRLHSITRNELGRNVHPDFWGSVNATIDQTILVFERRIATTK